MNQRSSRLLLSVTFVVLSGCSDDDGADVQPKPPVVDAGTGGSGGGSSGSGGGGGSGGIPDASVGGSGGGQSPFDAGFPPCVPSTDAGLPVAADAGDAGDALDAGDAGDAAAVAPAVVSFEAQLYPVFRARCVPCHETELAGNHNIGSPDLNESYYYARTLSSSVLERVNDMGMPPPYAPAPNNCNGPLGSPGCVSVEEYDLIQRWVGQCYPR